MRRSTRSNVHLAAMLNRARESGRSYSERGGATLPTQPRTPVRRLAALNACSEKRLDKLSFHYRESMGMCYIYTPDK
ncbi:uncharacterized [Tachysurus ichikawai]